MAGNLVQIHVNIPDGLVGEVLEQLNRQGGTVICIKQEMEFRTGIDESIHATNVAAFKAWLADFSGGQGHVSET
jgi:hypothetical protein